MPEERKGDWMQTFTGKAFWPLDPRQDEICIEDIAHSLSCQCRYTGHTLRFYSVAQHSVLVSRLVPREDALWGLLHDASEAYLVDLPRPLKMMSRLGDEYRLIETRLMKEVAARFGLSTEQPASVEQADEALLATEARDLMSPPPRPWRELVDPLPDKIKPWSSGRAEQVFLFEAGLLMSVRSGAGKLE
jgi:uncharacterized protein